MQFLQNRARELHKTLQFVQNQTVNIVKTRLVFPIIDRNADILSGRFNDLFSGS